MERDNASRRRVPLDTIPIMRIGAFALLLAIPFATPADGQQPKRDSVEARRKATGAQARFEMVRRSNLPLSYAGSGGQCDAHIGRFCQWNNDEDTIEAKQPRIIKRAREALVASLDSAQKKSPRDGWITGQRVRYLIEAHNDTAALRLLLPPVQRFGLGGGVDRPAGALVLAPPLGVAAGHDLPAVRAPAG